MRIQWTTYKFNPPYPERFIRPVSPIRKHPFGIITFLGFLEIFLIYPIYETSDSVPFGLWLILPGFIFGSFFSVISYSYYYYKCIIYDRNLEQKIRDSKNK